jgi:hypothetical protein
VTTKSKASEIEALFSNKSNWDLPEWMVRQLGAVHPELMWEFGRSIQAKGTRLVITPESSHHLRPLVHDLLERAPTIKNWEFYGHRLIEDLESARQTVEDRVARDISDFKFRASIGDGNNVDLTFSAPSITSQGDRRAFEAAFIATESLLGEECLNDWVGILEVVPWPGLPTIDQLAKKQAGRFLSLDHLKSTVDSLIAHIQEQLSRTPYFELDDESPWNMWELKPDEQDDYGEQEDLFVGLSANPLQWIAGRSRQRFCSKRFSGCGETFCYVKVDRYQGWSEDGFADKSEIEDALNEVLVPAKLGSHMGGGTGLRYLYVDLALTDVDKALDVIRARLQAGKAPIRTWIQFYDSDWKAEWVGVYDDTPPPPMTCFS